MTASANIYAHAIDNAFDGLVNWASDTLKIALLTSSYTPNLATHNHFSDVNSNESSGTAYTAGGVALSSVTHTITAANSWGVTWVLGTSYSTGSIVRPTASNGFLYYAEVGGVSSGSQPTWPTTVGATVADNTVTWTCIGQSLIQFSSASASWPASTIANAAYAVIYDSQTGVTSTEPLIALINFGGTVSSASSTLAVNAPSLGWFWIAV